jgi:hypothetical protein
MIYFFLTNIRYVIKRKYHKINKIVLSVQLDVIEKIGSILFLLVETLKLIQYNDIIYTINTTPNNKSEFVMDELFDQFSILLYKLGVLEIVYSSGRSHKINIDKISAKHTTILTIKYALFENQFRYPTISNNIPILKIIHLNNKPDNTFIVYTNNYVANNNIYSMHTFIDNTKTKSLDLSQAYFPDIDLLTLLIKDHDYKMVKLPLHILIAKIREYEVDDQVRYCYEIERLVFILLSKTINEPVISKESLISCYKTFYEDFTVYDSIINTNVREISFKDNDVIISDFPRPLPFIWYSNHLWYDALPKLIAKINDLKTNSDSNIEKFLVYFDNEYVTMINRIFSRHQNFM